MEKKVFNDILTIKTGTIEALEVIPQNKLEHILESLLNLCRKCITLKENISNKKNIKNILVSIIFHYILWLVAAKKQY